MGASCAQCALASQVESAPHTFPEGVRHRRLHPLHLQPLPTHCHTQGLRGQHLWWVRTCYYMPDPALPGHPSFLLASPELCCALRIGHSMINVAHSLHSAPH